MTLEARRAKRWREGKQTMADLRQIDRNTNVSELLLPVIGSVVTNRLKLKGWLTVEQLLKAGAKKATSEIPSGLPALHKQLTRVITVLGKHLRIQPVSEWSTALDEGEGDGKDAEEDDNEEDDSVSTSSSSHGGSPNPKRPKA